MDGKENNRKQTQAASDHSSTSQAPVRPGIFTDPGPETDPPALAPPLPVTAVAPSPDPLEPAAADGAANPTHAPPAS